MVFGNFWDALAVFLTVQQCFLFKSGSGHFGNNRSLSAFVNFPIISDIDQKVKKCF